MIADTEDSDMMRRIRRGGVEDSDNVCQENNGIGPVEVAMVDMVVVLYYIGNCIQYITGGVAMWWWWCW